MKRILGAILFASLSAVVLFAHGGMEHVLGTVEAISAHSISVKTTDGAIHVVAIDNETRFLRGDSRAALRDVQVGSRVVIHAHKHDGRLEAAEVKIGVTAPAAKP